MSETLVLTSMETGNVSSQLNVAHLGNYFKNLEAGKGGFSYGAQLPESHFFEFIVDIDNHENVIRMEFDVDLRLAENEDFQKLVFELSRTHAMAIYSSLDEENIIVTDKDLVAVAAKTFDTAEEWIEIQNHHKNCFDLLFDLGDDDLLQKNEQLEADLLSLGFVSQTQKKNSSSYLTLIRKILTHDKSPKMRLERHRDYALFVTPYEDQNWQNTRGLSFEIFAPNFPKVMQYWLENETEPLSKLRRVMVNYNTDVPIFFSGIVEFSDKSATATTQILGLGDTKIPLNEFVQTTEAIGQPNGIAQLIYGGALKNYFAPTEGLWVFLFNAAESGLNAQDTLDLYETLKSKNISIGTDDIVTIEIATAYQKLYHDALKN